MTQVTGRRLDRIMLELLASAFPLGWPELMGDWEDTAFRLIFGIENEGKPGRTLSIGPCTSHIKKNVNLS